MSILLLGKTKISVLREIFLHRHYMPLILWADHSVRSKDTNNVEMFQAMSATSISVGSMSNVSVLPEPGASSSKASSMLSYYKSLPALDQQHDQLDRELQHLSDSLDVLYQQEDSEIEFLDSFIDYDDISVDNGSLTGAQRLKPTAGRPPAIPSSHLQSKRKARLRESLRWLTHKGKLSFKFGSRDNLRSEGGGRAETGKIDLSEVGGRSDLVRHSRR